MRKKREASALHRVTARQLEGDMGIGDTAVNLLSLGMSDSSSQRDEGISQSPGPVSFGVCKEKNLTDISGHPSRRTERQPEQVPAQYRGPWLLEDAVLAGRQWLLFQRYKGRKR